MILTLFQGNAKLFDDHTESAAVLLVVVPCVWLAPILDL